MDALTSGDLLPEIVSLPPGPRSRQLAAELQRLESPNITFFSEDLPIFWREASGSNVLDVDGNRYIDLTAGFGVAACGHRNPGVTETIRQQLFRLQLSLGDVHPPQIKVRLLSQLAQITPGDLSVAILANSGAEAVEAALKTARLASGAPGVVYFEGAYHGLTYGALAVTDRKHFRAPFEDQLGIPTLKAPFPNPYRPPTPLVDASDIGAAALQWLDAHLDSESGQQMGAVIIEPIQGRGGIVVPPEGFLRGLRELCDRHGLILIFDEILTGMGRTGRWFAADEPKAVPDLICIGKALSGVLPFSACVGTPEVMGAWPPSSGEAIHTSTFLGHPLGCSAALAQIEQIKNGKLLGRAARLGELASGRLRGLGDRGGVGEVRGRGLLIGIEIVTDSERREPDADRAHAIMVDALKRGVILTSGGSSGNVLTLTPALTITEEQLAFALSVIEDCLSIG